MYSTSSIKWDKSPKLEFNSSFKNAPSLFTVANRFGKVWPDHKSSWISIRFHASENMPGFNYGSDLAVVCYLLLCF